MTEMKGEFVYWRDAAGHCDNIWRSDEDMDDLVPADVLSIGLLYKETDEYIVLVNSHDYTNDLVHGDLVILKANIRERHKL